MTVRSNSHSPRGFRLAGFVAAYAVLLGTVVVAALTWDAGARVSDARETVQVAALEVPLAPAVQAAFGAAAAGGTFSGTITFEGTPPEMKPAANKNDPTVKDPAVCLANGDVPNESLVINPQNKGIANVFVFLPKAPAGADVPKPPAGPVIFDQKFCRFIPHAMVIQAPQTVLVMSGDTIPHNTRIAPLRNNGFNQTVPPEDRKGVKLEYKKPEKLPIEVRCDFHPWMKAYHLILDHPWMAVTDADGKFTIKDVPVGQHKFIIWQESKGYLEREFPVEIKAGETKDIKLSYDAKKFMAFEVPQPKTVTVAY